MSSRSEWESSSPAVVVLVVVLVAFVVVVAVALVAGVTVVGAGVVGGLTRHPFRKPPHGRPPGVNNC